MGAVVTDAAGTMILGFAHRGEDHLNAKGEKVLGRGCHAEYILLESKLRERDLRGCHLYTTLEPCTKRGPAKTPCAQRIIDRGLSAVYVATIDPNPIISSRGIRQLSQAGIRVELFPFDLRQRADAVNSEFISSFQLPIEIDPHYAMTVLDRSLDDWYTSVTSIYRDRNFYRSPESILAHLVEICGSIAMGVSSRSPLRAGEPPPIDTSRYIRKGIAWWMALCRKMGIESISDVVWEKFPGVCTYCHRSPHEPGACVSVRQQLGAPDWSALQLIAGEGSDNRPRTLGEWQRMFQNIYAQDGLESGAEVAAKLTEELGELSEAVRVRSVNRGYFRSEAADLFAWLMRAQNYEEARAHQGGNIDREFGEAYPDCCIECRSIICSCRPILPSTVGRIASQASPAAGDNPEV